MSLTSVLNQPETRRYLKNRIQRPPMPALTDIAVSELQKGTAGRVGTAFDYAMRFGLQARGWGTMSPLVALNALEMSAQLIACTGCPLLPDEETRRPSVSLFLSKGLSPGMQHSRIQHIFTALNAHLSRWVDHDTLPAELAESLLWLAELDLYTRRGEFDLNQVFTPEEVPDLQNMYRLIPWEQFRPQHRLILNPRFGEGSERIGGADADILLDDCLIDIKTIKKSTLRIESIRQVVGYALLNNRFGTTAHPKTSVSRVGIYFSRAGQLMTWNLNDCIHPADHDVVLERLLAA